MPVSYDEVLSEHVGEFGLYQKMIFLMAGAGGIAMALFNVGIVFLAAVPDHWCKSSTIGLFDLSEAQERNLTIPYASDDGTWQKCQKYDRLVTRRRRNNKWDTSL